MIAALFPSCPIKADVLDRLRDVIARDRTVWVPVSAADGACRLQPRAMTEFPRRAATARLPVKKLLFPHGEPVWGYRDGRYHAADRPPAMAIVGLPLCDLQALWYLDQVFAEEALYQQRRESSLVVGLPCHPGPECRCDGTLMPISGDLFVGCDDVWALSHAGSAILSALGECLHEKSLPWPDLPVQKSRTMTARQFHAQPAAGFWSQESERCVSCGACSAVCPTCYCFDLLDVAALSAPVRRIRVWDNCFFAEHGQVAGGFDFRVGRAERLRFRLEHKRLGFGVLNGQDSCVGCGRCRTVCPADIDLDRMVEQLMTEANDAG